MDEGQGRVGRRVGGGICEILCYLWGARRALCSCALHFLPLLLLLLTSLNLLSSSSSSPPFEHHTPHNGRSCQTAWVGTQTSATSTRIGNSRRARPWYDWCRVCVMLFGCRVCCCVFVFYIQHKQQRRLCHCVPIASFLAPPPPLLIPRPFAHRMLLLRAAQVVEANPPPCKFWNFQLNNYWMESLDYRYFPIHVNKVCRNIGGEGGDRERRHPRRNHPSPLSILAFTNNIPPPFFLCVHSIRQSTGATGAS